MATWTFATTTVNRNNETDLGLETRQVSSFYFQLHSCCSNHQEIDNFLTDFWPFWPFCWYWTPQQWQHWMHGDPNAIIRSQWAWLYLKLVVWRILGRTSIRMLSYKNGLLRKMTLAFRACNYLAFCHFLPLFCLVQTRANSCEFARGPVRLL